ncbi:MAG: hypothetical protein KGR98_06215, partial [Verrucomicrobia bacterium]|nr:hypothetical protein [Verrucomicrobiota bacterium]
RIALLFAGLARLCLALPAFAMQKKAARHAAAKWFYVMEWCVGAGVDGAQNARFPDAIRRIV